MIFDFLNGLTCVLKEELSDYQDTLREWESKNYHTAFMPAITWYGGTLNLLDSKAGEEAKNMIWLVPAGQADFYWLPDLKKKIENFYTSDEIEFSTRSVFPNTEVEEFEECILLHSDDIQNDEAHTILGANVILLRFSLPSGRETLVFILLDHQDVCWQKIIENHRIALTWFVDSGRGTEDYFARINLYQRMKETAFPELLPALYFKGLYNKGEIPDGFQYQYSLIRYLDRDGYDTWKYFSGVYNTGWGK